MSIDIMYFIFTYLCSKYLEVLHIVDSELTQIISVIVD